MTVRIRVLAAFAAEALAVVFAGAASAERSTTNSATNSLGQKPAAEQVG
jgi:hypothetical protein